MAICRFGPFLPFIIFRGKHNVGGLVFLQTEFLVTPKWSSLNLT